MKDCPKNQQDLRIYLELMGIWIDGPICPVSGAFE